MEKIVFFNIAWMKDYKGVTPNDIPVHGGKYIKDNKYGGEIYNFQVYEGKMYGFVEAGWKPKPRCINIVRLGALKRQDSIGNVLVIWVARSCNESGTFVVGWYKDATVYRERQPAPEGSNRGLPGGEDAPYFAEADEYNCYCIPPNGRDFPVPRGECGFGQKNIWYAESQLGKKTKAEVLKYIKKVENALKLGG